jgi:predicted GH43/DUF377 family glycosyl hydrolase
MRRTTARLDPDPARVIAHLFLPGEELFEGRSRAAAVVARVMALPENEVEKLADQLLADFGPRHNHYLDLLDRHAAIIATRLDDRATLSAARRQVLGATFTSEFSIEAAALMNPSAVVSPDQSGLEPGQLRVVLGLRAIGEGHISSIGFAEAVIGPGPMWTFQERRRPAVSGTTSAGWWTNRNLRSVLSERWDADEVGRALLDSLPAEFDTNELGRAVGDMYPELLARPGAEASITIIRRIVQSAYTATFDEDVALSQRVLFPTAAEENNGMEDLRLTRFVDPDGEVSYRGIYTAYNGRQIAPKLLVSSDLRTFAAHRLGGPAARNKGMALFPRTIDGHHLALCRTDGESTGLAVSDDGHIWGAPIALHRPTTKWELLQVGNCGPPIETDHGWLVLTHAVGPMRLYSISAILLDLDDPRRVVGQLSEPLLVPGPDEQNGYVPNVVYSCGAVVHDGRLWMPYGIDDSRIGVAWAPIEELLDQLLANR